MSKKLIAGVGVAAFIFLVVVSNWLTSEYGLIGGFVTAGTFTAGLTLAARDVVRESAGTWISMACIVAGAAASVVMAGPALAVASGVAFGLSELVDAAIYEPLRRRSKVTALAWSNVVGSVVDGVLFLTIAGFAVWPAIVGQVAVKWFMCVALPLLAIGVGRAVLRNRIRTQSA